MGIGTPDKSDDVIDFLDWLELSSIFSPNQIFRLDELENCLEIGEDYTEIDVGTDDSTKEGVRDDIAAEFRRRKGALDGTYPFEFSPNGEEILFNGINGLGKVTYVLSLIVQHSWKDGLLSEPHKIADGEWSNIRRAFEILAAMACAGYAGGPSFHIGRNRGGANNLMQHLRTAWERILDGAIRAQPIVDAPRGANDDGVDVIAYKPNGDGPPPYMIVFAQSAAGRDWQDKSVRNEIVKFVRNWFEVPPVCDITPVMVTAALPIQNVAMQETVRLGHLVHRLRMPKYVSWAQESAQQDELLLDCTENIGLGSECLQLYFDSRGVEL